VAIIKPDSAKVRGDEFNTGDTARFQGRSKFIDARISNGEIGGHGESLPETGAIESVS